MELDPPIKSLVEESFPMDIPRTNPKHEIKQVALSDEKHNVLGTSRASVDGMESGAKISPPRCRG